jgi:hypothetical protein
MCSWATHCLTTDPVAESNTGGGVQLVTENVSGRNVCDPTSAYSVCVNHLYCTPYSTHSWPSLPAPIGVKYYISAKAPIHATGNLHQD